MEKLLGGLLIPVALDQDIQYVAVLIDDPPQVVMLDLVQEVSESAKPV